MRELDAPNRWEGGGAGACPLARSRGCCTGSAPPRSRRRVEEKRALGGHAEVDFAVVKRIAEEELLAMRGIKR